MSRKITDTELLANHFSREQPLHIKVITLSDRAAQGVYEDKSGARLREIVEAFFATRAIPTKIHYTLLTDDPARLKEELLSARNAEMHIVFTSGGTGVGPRDNTPEVVLELADKIIPGIMESIRMKYGVDKPCALLSRTVAATMGDIVVYALPGSTRGVEEYLGEILKSIEHLVCVLHGLDVH